MKFCIKCGNKLEEGDSVCPKCGQAVKKVEADKAKVADEQFSFCIKCGNKMGISEKKCSVCGQEVISNNPVVRKKISKKTKIVISTVLFLIVFCIVGYAVGSKLTSKNNLATRFKDAVASNDTKKLASIIKSSDSKLQIDSENIKPFMEYLKNNKSYYNEVIDEIEAQSKGTSNTDLEKTLKDLVGENKIITLKTDGKKYLFFNNYILQIKPSYINVNTDYKGSDIFLNDKKVATSDEDNFSKKIGPFVPGIYNIKASYVGKYATLEKKEEVDLISDASDVNDVGMSLNGRLIDIYCDYADAELYANGKDTGLRTNEISGFGPVDDNTKLYAQEEFPWGIVKSEEVQVSSDYIEMEINPVNDEMKSAIETTISEFNKSDFEATTARDVKKYVNVTDEFAKELKSEIDSMISENQFFTGKLTKNIFDLNSIRVSKDGEAYKCEISVWTYANYTYYAKDEKPVLKPKDYKHDYILIYDTSSKKWSVDNITTNYNFDSSNVDEVKLD